MITSSSSSTYRIVGQAISLIENALSDPNKIQMSCSTGSTIMVYDSENGIGTDASGEYRTWKMSARNTRLTKADAHFLYARLSRTGNTGQYVWSVNDYDVVTTDYYYIKVGSITETESAPDFDADDYTPREITLDYGALGTPKYQEEGRSNGFEEAFGFGTYTEGGETKAQIVPKLPFVEVAIRTTLRLFGNAITRLLKSEDFADAETLEAISGEDALVTAGVVRKVIDWTKGKLSALETWALAKFLRKDVADTASGVITFAEQPVLKEGFKTDDYIPGMMGTGAALNKDNTGTHFEVDFLTIRKRLEALEVQIQKMSHIGGQIVLSAASAVITEIESRTDEIDDAPLIRCYFDAIDSDGNETQNEWAEGDLARCQTFNLATVNGVTTNRYWWRLVRGVSGTPANRNGVMRHWFDVYAGDDEEQCDPASDLPAVGDNVAQLGNITDTDRQNAIIEAGAGTASPYHRQYKGINTFALTDSMIKIDLNPAHAKLNVDEWHLNTGDGSKSVYDIVGEATGALSEEIDRQFEDQMSFVNSDKPAPKNGTSVYTTLTVAQVAALEPSLNWDADEREGYANTYLVWSDGLCYRFDGTAWQQVNDAYLISYIQQLNEQQKMLDDMANDNIITELEAKQLKNISGQVNGEYAQVAADARYVGIEESYVTTFEKQATALGKFYAYMNEHAPVQLSRNVMQNVPGAELIRRVAIKTSAGTETIRGTTYSQYDIGYVLEPQSSLTGWNDFYQVYQIYIQLRTELQSMISRKTYSRSITLTDEDGVIRDINDRLDQINEDHSTQQGNIQALGNDFAFYFTKTTDAFGNVIRGVSSQGGLLTTGDYAALVAQAIDEEGNVIAEALAASYVAVDENGVVKSGYTVKADQITFEGQSIDFQLGEQFTVSSENFSVDKNGVVTIRGMIRRGHLTINAENSELFFTLDTVTGKYYLDLTQSDVEGNTDRANALRALASSNWIEIAGLSQDILDASGIEILLPCIDPQAEYTQDDLDAIRDYIGQSFAILNNTERTINVVGLVFSDEFWTGVNKNTGAGLWNPVVMADSFEIGDGLMAVLTCHADVPVAFSHVQNETVWWKPYLCTPKIAETTDND